VRDDIPALTALIATSVPVENCPQRMKTTCFGVLETQFGYTVTCKHVVAEDTSISACKQWRIPCLVLSVVVCAKKKAVITDHGLAVQVLKFSRRSAHTCRM